MAFQYPWLWDRSHSPIQLNVSMTHISRLKEDKGFRLSIHWDLSSRIQGRGFRGLFTFHGDGVIIGAVLWLDPVGEERPQLRLECWEDPRRRRLLRVSRTSSIPVSRHFSLQRRLSSASTRQHRQVCAARVKSRGVRKLRTYRASSLGNSDMKSR